MEKRNNIMLLLFTLFFLMCSLAGCSPQLKDMVVLEVGKEKVTLKEFENFYVRNSGGWEVGKSSDQQERERFLDLLTNYKLKLLYAYDNNFHKDPEIVEELRDYRASLVQSFLVEREVTQPGIKQMYDRRLEEIRAQHILISLKPDATPSETLAAWNKAMDIINLAKRGESFDSLALRYSEDKSVTNNKGDINYFTGGQMIPSFEDAAFAMNKGEISSHPVRTSFGYHIIKILDRRPASGQMRVKHIIVSFYNPADSSDTSNALKRIQSIQDSLKRGWSFEDLANQFSDDKSSAHKGGDLGWFDRIRWAQFSEEVAFKLKEGEVSNIIRSRNGYHLIKCDSLKPPPPFVAIKDELKNAYQQFRYNNDYNAYVSRLKKRCNYSFKEDAFETFVSYLDSTLSVSDSAWDANVPKEVRDLPLFVTNNFSVTIDSVIGILNKKREYESVMLRKKELLTRLNKIGEAIVFEDYAIGLEDRNPEFASLMKEYRDGVVLFKAEQVEVWDKIVLNDSLLKRYYEDNRSKFMFPEMVDISQINLDSDTLAAMVYDSLINYGAKFVDLAERYNDDNPELKAKRGERGLLPINQDDVTQYAAKLEIGKISEPIETENGLFVIVRLNRKVPPREKTFEEAGAEVSNSFQEYESERLKKQWIEDLKLRYPVKQYKEALKVAFTEPR